MRSTWLALPVWLVACRAPSDRFFNEDDRPRLIAPLSMTTVTQRQPTLRWVLGDPDATPVIDLCSDRACTAPLPTVTRISTDRLSAVPMAPLRPGPVFWRVRIIEGAHTLTSATWQFWVGNSSASTAVDTSNGAILDVNGDGYPDLLVGALGVDTTGAAHLYLGSAKLDVTTLMAWNGPPSTERIDLASPDGNGAFFGGSVASAGDVNGDGFGDFLVGAVSLGPQSGNAHLYLGSATPNANEWNRATDSRRIDLTNPVDGSIHFGVVAAAGDVNGDGFADFIVGRAIGGGGQPAHVYLGGPNPTQGDWNGPSPPGRSDVMDPADSQPGAASDEFSRAVAGAGDVNGDGFSDFIVAAPNRSDPSAGASAGAAYLYLGAASPGDATWNGGAPIRRIVLLDPDGANASFGAVAFAGDVNGDGYADLLIGAPGAHAGLGAAHLYLGTAMPQAAVWNGMSAQQRIDLEPPPTGQVGGAAPSGFGVQVTGAGDVNGDGFADLLIGSSGSTAAGSAHLYLGSAVPSAKAWTMGDPVKPIRFDLTDADGTVFGSAVASAGDVNRDGYADFLVGAPNASGMEGSAHLYLGGESPLPSMWNDAPHRQRLDLTNPDGTNARFGISLASARTLQIGSRSLTAMMVGVRARRGGRP